MSEDLESIGRLLLAEGPVTQEELEKSLRQAGLGDSALGRALLSVSHVRLEELLSFLAVDYQWPQLGRIQDLEIPESVISMLPSDLAVRHRMLPLALAGSILLVAKPEPPDESLVRELRRRLGTKVKFMIGPEEQIVAVLRQRYRKGTFDEAPAAQVGIEPIPISEQEYAQAAHEAGAEMVRRWEEVHAGDQPVAAPRVL